MATPSTTKTTPVLFDYEITMFCPREQQEFIHRCSVVDENTAISDAIRANPDSRILKILNHKVDELAELHEFLAPYLDKYEKLKKAISATVPLTDTDHTLHGQRFDIDYTAPSKQLKCNVDAKDFIKATKAWDAVTVSVTKAKDCLTPDQIGMLFNEEIGARRFKRVRLSLENLEAMSKQSV